MFLLFKDSGVLSYPILYLFLSFSLLSGHSIADPFSFHDVFREEPYPFAAHQI